MFSRILIANRGEIACRIIRTCRRLGIRTVAVYSEADASARHVALADEAVAIGPPAAAQSYLDIGRIIKAAERTGAEAIHPGYGFLAENPLFPEACAASGITFIGPGPEAIRLMGLKSAAKAKMAAAGVPVVPGYHGEDQSPATLAAECKKIGFPVLIKAAAGGGGKGMRIVRSRKELEDALASAQREAKSAFDDARVILERYLEAPRHIEVQVFGDRHGNVVHLFERDCSVQRRHQKVLEEAPAPGMTAERREAMGAAAVAAARAIDYEGAGTVEFIVDRNGDYFFMEMNTRLQVEHPVTELITGQDLVEWQIRIAAGEKLPLKQDEIVINGHALEARVYAEDPARDFLPATGHIAHLRFPEMSNHVRVDTGVREGDNVTMHYDPMIAKVIVWDRDRAGCLRRMREALKETQVVGVSTNLDLLISVTAHQAFQAGGVDTGFIERHRDELLVPPGESGPALLALAALYLLRQREAKAAERARRSPEPGSPWHDTHAWRLNGIGEEEMHFLWQGSERPVKVRHGRGILTMEIDGTTLGVDGRLDGSDLVADVDGRRARATVVLRNAALTILMGGSSHTLEIVDRLAAVNPTEAVPGSLASPMPGRVVSVLVKEGEKVKAGAPLVVIEAMKMEHTVTAPLDGTVTTLHYAAGDMIDEGVELLVIAQ